MKTAGLAVALLLAVQTLPLPVEAGSPSRPARSLHSSASVDPRTRATLKNGELVRDANAPARTWGVIRDDRFIPVEWQDQVAPAEPILDEKPAPPKAPQKKQKKGSSKKGHSCPADHAPATPPSR